MIRPAILILSVFVLSGCWSRNFDEPGRVEVDKLPTEAVVPGEFERVWMATQSVMGKFTVIQRDQETETQRAYLVTDWMRGKSDTLYRGFDVTRIPYTIRYKLYIYLVGERNGTRVTIKSEEQYLDDAVTAGVDFNGSLMQWTTTPSSTIKENRLLMEIDKLVRDPNFKPTASAL
jgi:hypothetical protein